MIVNFIRGTFKLMKSMDFFMETCFFVFFKVPNIYFGKTVISAQIKNVLGSGSNLNWEFFGQLNETRIILFGS